MRRRIRHLTSFTAIRTPALAELAPVRPYLSSSQVEAPAYERAIDLGKRHIPLSSSQPVLLREGSPFWQPLVSHGVDTMIYRMPANYPPLHAMARATSLASAAWAPPI